MRTRTVLSAVTAATAVAAVTATGLPWASGQKAPPTMAVAADLRADVNRDGVVDVTGATDEPDEDVWSGTRGATILPNLDDDSRRCPAKAPDGKPLSDAVLAACNDAADAVVNGAADEAYLARIRTVPMPAAGEKASATVVVSGPGAATHTRVFVRVGTTWKPLTPGAKLTAGQVRAGVELGIEATDIVRGAGTWTGRVSARFAVDDGVRKSADTVALTVAPLLSHHPLQAAQQVLVTRTSGTSPEAKENQRFVRDLATQVKASGIKEPLFTFSYPADSEDEDIWAQDFFEPMYLSIPGAGGKPIGMRVLLRSPQNHLPEGRKAGRQLYERLRGPGVGVVEVPGMKPSEDWNLSSLGNLETIPPYRLGTTDFPAGRIVMGQRADIKSKPSAALLRLLNAQGAQTPLLLDVSWLTIGHIDEFVHFLPASTPRGWRIAVADPDAGMAVLRAAVQKGGGGAKLASAPTRNELWGTPPDTTVAQALADPKFVAHNRLAAAKISASIAVLQKETGASAAELVRVPALFHQPTGPGEDEPAGSPPRAATATPRLTALLPSAVNGVLLTPNRYLMPKQYGPVVGGVDVLTAAVSSVYQAAGITPAYADDWYVYHAGKGDIHCGTNVLRTYAEPWWKAAPAQGR